MMCASTSSRTDAVASAMTSAAALTRFERAALFVGIVEIPLQIDKYFAYHEYDGQLGAVAGLNFSMTTISLLALYGKWIVDASLHQRRQVLRTLFGIPMLLYLFCVLISTLSAAVPLLSLFDFALLVQAYLLYFFVANRVQTHEDVLFCVLVMATALLMQSLVIFFAEAIGMDDQIMSFGPLVLTVSEGRRHGGTMHSPVLTGSTMALLWLPVVAALRIIRNKSAWRFAALATTTGLLGILMTQTRGAILTSAVGAHGHWRRNAAPWMVAKMDDWGSGAAVCGQHLSIVFDVSEVRSVRRRRLGRRTRALVENCVGNNLCAARYGLWRGELSPGDAKGREPGRLSRRVVLHHSQQISAGLGGNRNCGPSGVSGDSRKWSSSRTFGMANP